MKLEEIKESVSVDKLIQRKLDITKKYDDFANDANQYYKVYGKRMLSDDEFTRARFDYERKIKEVDHLIDLHKKFNKANSII